MGKSIFLLIVCFQILSCNSSHTKTQRILALDSLKSVQAPIKEEYIQFIPDSILCNALNYFVNSLPKNLIKSERYLDKTPFYVLTGEDSLKLQRLDTIFSSADLDFIFKQNHYSKYFELNKCVNNKEFISADTLMKFMGDDFWTKFRKKYDAGGYITICVPLFSIKKDIVIIRYAVACGRLCGHGSTIIYKKQGHKWKELIYLDNWIS